MAWVFSTATHSIRFTQWELPKNPRVLPKAGRSVTIKGGANLADKHLHTPNGVATEVSDDDLAFLMGNDAFMKAVKSGYMVVDRNKANLDSVVNDMKPKDGSAPKVPGDFEKDPKTGAAPLAA
jgi:hypothetical protein